MLRQTSACAQASPAISHVCLEHDLQVGCNCLGETFSGRDFICKYSRNPPLDCYTAPHLFFVYYGYKERTSGQTKDYCGTEIGTRSFDGSYLCAGREHGDIDRQKRASYSAASRPADAPVNSRREKASF